MSYLRAIRLVNFRNYADETVLFTPGLNVVVGENARGKTNLLEAVYFAVAGSTPGPRRRTRRSDGTRTSPA